jgi:hypothetical protein
MGMNHHGYITRPDLIDFHRAGATIKAALTAMYAEGRFVARSSGMARTAAMSTLRKAMPRTFSTASTFSLMVSGPTPSTIAEGSSSHRTRL